MVNIEAFHIFIVSDFRSAVNMFLVLGLYSILAPGRVGQLVHDLLMVGHRVVRGHVSVVSIDMNHHLEKRKV